MKLYRVELAGTYKHTKFIIANSSLNAIIKYYEIKKDIRDHQLVSAEFICNRDDIVPTIDPLKEKF